MGTYQYKNEPVKKAVSEKPHQGPGGNDPRPQSRPTSKTPPYKTLEN